MASVKNDLGLRGRLGNCVFYNLRGKSFVRIQGKSNNPNTEKQLEMRTRFMVAIRFYQRLKETPLKSVLSISAQGKSASGYSFYMEKNLKAFRANGSIGDFSQLQFSAGKRERGRHLRGAVDERGEVVLQWSSNYSLEWEEDDDRLMLVVLHEKRPFSPEVIECSRVLRKDGLARFPMKGWDGETLHLYCFFVSPDGEQVSTSQYVRLQREV